MKPKTAFESGNSPPKVSENGAAIQTGAGIQDVARRIQAEFEKIHNGHPAPEKQPKVYTEAHKERFHQRAKRLSLAALSSSCIMKARSNVFEITVPTESA